MVRESGNPNLQHHTSGSIKMQNLDLETLELRDVNQTLQSQSKSVSQSEWAIINARGNHAIAVGIDAPIEVTVTGSTG